MDLLRHNGDLVVPIMRNSLVMIIHKEDHILLRIHNIHLHHMVIIRRHRLREAIMVQVGSKGLRLQCMGPHLRATTTMGSSKVQIMGIHLILKLLPNPLDMDTTRLNMITMLPPNILGTWVLSQHHTRKVVHIQGMVHRTNMVSHPCTACSHKYLIRNPMVSLGLINLEKCLIKVQVHQLNHMVKMCHLNSPTPMHQVGQCNKAILSMGLHPLLMDMVILLPQHLLLVILLKVVSRLLGMVSLELNSRLHTLRQDLQGVMVHIQQLSLVMPNNQLPAMQHMGIKGLQIRLMVQPKVLLLILRLLLGSLVMLNHLKLSLAMIRPVVMETYPHQLGMEKVCHPKLHMHNMILVRCMVHIVDFVY